MGFFTEGEIGVSDSVLLTDLYELTMLQAYYELGMDQESIFSLFVRKLPSQRNYLLACGLDDVLTHLERLAFTPKQLDYLRGLDLFKEDFLQWLTEFSFTGDVFALPEGTPFFANEPLLEIKAPIGQAQLIETFVLNQIHYQTLIASKAHRVVQAAGDRTVFDFGLRRIHGTDAGMKAARSFYLAGGQATSNTLAGSVYGIPVSGTMAHSFIQAHDNELRAFQDFARIYPNTILLIDTYDPLAGIEKVIKLSREQGDDFVIQGVRIDSSDLTLLSRAVRTRLDAAGLFRVKIFASGSLDEYEIAKMIKQQAPIDGFGVGTKMGVSSDVPYLDMVYKLTTYNKTGRIKKSSGKETLPCQKQVFRNERGGKYDLDILAGFEEEKPGRPLLRQVMDRGKRLPPGRENLARIRERVLRQTAKLPRDLLQLTPTPSPYQVKTSSFLQQELDKLQRELSQAE